MAKYSVQAPDGKVYVLEGPEGATTDDIMKAAQSLAQAHATERPPSPEHAVIAAHVANDAISRDAKEGPSFLRELANQTGNLIAGGVRGAGSIGATLLAPVDAAARAVNGGKPISVGGYEIAGQNRRADMDAGLTDLGADTTSPAFQVGKVGAEIAGTAGAGGVVANGAARIPVLAARAPALIQAIRTGGLAADGTAGMSGAVIRAGGGAINGATQAAMVDPSQAGTGAGLGAALPGAVRVAGVAGRAIGGAVPAVRDAILPFTQAGQQVIVGRALNRAAGQDAPAVVNQLQQAAQPFVGPNVPGLTRTTLGEIVPGSLPSVAEAAGNPGVSALQRAAAATQPDVTNQLAALATSQNAARRNVLERMAGADGERDFAAANRDATAEQLYGAARTNGVNPAALTPEAQANIASMQARLPDNILAQARELARINGEPMDDTTAVSGMHYVKQALDDAISAARQSGNPTRARALTRLQQDYLTGLDQLSPDYGAARRTYADMSRPVNQMDVAQELLDRSANPVTGTITPAAFARSLSDRTAARATGFPGATLEGTMDGHQLNQLQSILEDLRRSNAAQNAGRGPGSNTVQNLAYSDILAQSGATPGMSLVVRGAAGIPVMGRMAEPIREAYANANTRLANQLAQAMLSPADAAAAMRLAEQADSPNQLMQLLAPYMRNGRQVIPQAAARAAPVIGADR